MNDHRLRITLEGPEVGYESQYGPRSNRETLATITVGVDAVLGFELVAHVLAEVSPEYPNAMEATDA